MGINTIPDATTDSSLVTDSAIQTTEALETTDQLNELVQEQRITNKYLALMNDMIITEQDID